MVLRHRRDLSGPLTGKQEQLKLSVKLWPQRDKLGASKEVHSRKLTDMFVQARKGGERNEMIWDERCPHLALSVRTTGYKSWSVIYRATPGINHSLTILRSTVAALFSHSYGPP
jgi:hypothetical protein